MSERCPAGSRKQHSDELLILGMSRPRSWCQGAVQAPGTSARASEAVAQARRAMKSEAKRLKLQSGGCERYFRELHEAKNGSRP